MACPVQEIVYNVDCLCGPEQTAVQEDFLPPSERFIGPQIPERKPIPESVFRDLVKKTNKIEDVETKEKENTSRHDADKKAKETMRKRKDEFLEKGAQMALHGAVEQKVKCACMITDQLLVQKRTKLRELLLAEEIAYAAEYIEICQKTNASRLAELQNRAFEVQANAERKRKEIAEQKLMKQKIESCEAARPVRSRKALLEVKKDQLWQIKEKHALEEARREEDKMYHDIMMKNILSMQENEEENAKLARIKQKEVQKSFIEQMKWKEQKEEEERQLKECERLQLDEEIRLFKGISEKELQEKKAKREKIKTEFMEFFQKDKEIKERRKREEEEIDRTFWQLMKNEEEKERKKVQSDKERLKREMDVFLEKSRELQRMRDEEEKKLEIMLEELNQKKIMQKNAEVRLLNEKRKEQFCNVLRERQEQIRAKEIQEKVEQEERQRGIELLTLQLEQQRKLREEYERRCAEEREIYRCQLLQQIHEVEEAKKRKKEAENEYERKKKAEEEKEIEEVKALLRALPVGGLDHPMKAICKEQPPRYTCPHSCPP